MSSLSSFFDSIVGRFLAVLDVIGARADNLPLSEQISRPFAAWPMGRGGSTPRLTLDPCIVVLPARQGSPCSNYAATMRCAENEALDEILTISNVLLYKGGAASTRRYESIRAG
jgi:hypothetical protein